MKGKNIMALANNKLQETDKLQSFKEFKIIFQ